MSANKLKFNQQKTEVFFCRPSCSKEGVPVDTLAVGDATVPIFREVVGGTSRFFDLICLWKSKYLPFSSCVCVCVCVCVCISLEQSQLIVYTQSC